jgi:hypothetical protein
MQVITATSTANQGKPMFILIHRFTGKALLRFPSLEEALVALQEAAVPDLFYITANKEAQ